ncbi:MAG: hypothetical protein J6Q94_01330 [Clostridia bacterium]|nr:hypothetical protein [Clostridia bacterium]
MKKFTKILSVFMAMLMVVTCIPMTSYARDTQSLDAYLSTDNLSEVVEDLLTSLKDRKEEIIPSVLSICFEAIIALRETAEENGVDVATASTKELADLLIVYVDEVLEEADLNSQLPSEIASLVPIIGIKKLDLSSVDSILQVLADVGKIVKGKTAMWGTLASLDVSPLVKDSKKNTAISTKNSTGLDILYGLFDFLAAKNNIKIYQTLINGKLDLGNMNGTIKTFADLDLEATVNDMMGDNLGVMIKEMLYSSLIAGEGDPEFAASVYKDFGNDALLAAALLKAVTGEEVSKADAEQLAAMTVNEIIAKYADSAFAGFLVEPLNTDVKAALNDLIAMDDQLAVLKNIINLNYEFKASDFNFAQMANKGIFESLNNFVCKIAEVILQPAVYTELGLKAGGNENVTANLTSVFAYVLKTLAANNGGKLEFTINDVAYSFDFSGFTADKIAGKSLEDMVVAVVSLFYPTLLQMELPAEVKTMEQLAGYTAYVCIDKFMVKDDSIDFTKDYKSLVMSNGKVRDMSQTQWSNVLGEMGMDVAIYWLNDATNFGMTQADVDALKADGWTWENFLEEIVDWALNYIKGIPAVADELEFERGVIDGNGAWYKLNVVLNELLPLGFFTGCGDETFTFDVYTAVMGKIIPAAFDCDFAELTDIFAANNNKNNPLNKSVISAVLSTVDNLLFSIFNHECGSAGSFEKAATATHDGYKGTYCKANGHYFDVVVVPATGETEPLPTDPTEPSTQPQPSDPSTQPSDPADPDVMMGDMNGDSKITASDARAVLRISAKLDKADAAKEKIADIDGNGKITASDARKILRFSAKLDKVLGG